MLLDLESTPLIVILNLGGGLLLNLNPLGFGIFFNQFDCLHSVFSCARSRLAYINSLFSSCIFTKLLHKLWPPSLWSQPQTLYLMDIVPRLVIFSFLMVR